MQINNLTKVYRSGKVAVDNLSLHVEAGDIFGFIGHNGAGKTTTLKCSTGVIPFDSGDILIDGVSIKTDPVACKLKMAFIPDNPEIYLFLTGIQYLNLVADIYRVPVSLRQERIDRYAKELQLYDNLADLVSSYSHGMKQKLAIIAAFIHEPKILLLDEPFVGLDPKAAFTVKQMMQELCAKGSAVFFSTHVLEVAEKLCNKIAIIKDGRLVIAGPTKKVKGEKGLEAIFLELVQDE